MLETTSGVTGVVFVSEWCNVCREMMPIMEQAAEALAGRCTFYTIDFDSSLNTAVACGVMVVPTLVLFKAGKSVDRVAGFIPEEKLLARVQAQL